MLVEENTFIKFTAPAFAKSISEFRAQLESMIRYHEKRSSGLLPTESERLATLGFMRTVVPARSDGNAWLFRNPLQNVDAFAGVADDWLGHRLGLNIAVGGETRITFGFAAAHVDDIRRPTFHDVPWSFLPLWDWQGKTKPLPRTPAAKVGLEEVVGKPPEIGRINRPVVRIKLQPR